MCLCGIFFPCAEWLVRRVNRLIIWVRRRVGGEPAYVSVVQACDDYFTEDEFDAQQSVSLLRTGAEAATPIARV
ncbi:hypothetical protein BVTX09c1_013 [Bovine papular stomatitis virus]|uniref:Uncharacterized protein n=1 Tax=Bovine papular stomatitis virus TaxID=129727 RepID=A0A0E3XAD4_9POXV|nr:hypothetical protein BVTX09c1_013 [Bovine papular stomatitis virus]